VNLAAMIAASPTYHDDQASKASWILSRCMPDVEKTLVTDPLITPQATNLKGLNGVELLILSRLYK
jgi:hypothetical protein